MKIGMLTSGGDCQGLNAALRGVAKTLYNELGDNVRIYGIRDGYRGLIEGDYHEMKPDDFSDILTLAAPSSAPRASRSSRCSARSRTASRQSSIKC